MTLDHPVRSGLCHGPDCQAKITGESQSEDFCSDWCQARWQSAHVDAKPETSRWVRGGTPVVYAEGAWLHVRLVEEPQPVPTVEALRLDLSLGARHHLSGGVYEVTATDGRNATLTPVEGY